MSEESTDDSDLEEGPGPRKELAMRASSIADCLNSLYRLSYKIRNPTLRPTTTKAILYKEVDPETGIDVFDQFYALDDMHIRELFALLRQGRHTPDGFEDYLAPRLAASITLRRRCFKYWQKHSRKLSRAVELGELIPELPGLDLANMRLNPRLEDSKDQNTKLKPPSAVLASTTILSKTDATPYDPNLDDRTERETVMSFASTALDADGKGIDLPAAPPQAKKGEEFTCPYCFVLCPSKQGHKKAWRLHILHDLQPYVCTYRDCPHPNGLYRSRSQWVKHEESVHRQCWRCFEHPNHTYTSAAGLRGHLGTDHSGNLTEEQIDDLVNVYSSTLIDDRAYCPVCFLEQPFATGIANHIANHLERAALFALPRSPPGTGESDPGSAKVHGKRADSRGLFDSEGYLSSFEGTDDRGSEGDPELLAMEQEEDVADAISMDLTREMTDLSDQPPLLWNTPPPRSSVTPPPR
ncbi:hypothetical protein IMZ48_16980 [Candidatus Bathyarchaeota archaeon]|nr:hypothetical protein [Candidatus Bathyarchaeota archaeon]